MFTKKKGNGLGNVSSSTINGAIALCSTNMRCNTLTLINITLASLFYFLGFPHAKQNGVNKCK
jgi:hypothetical protein